jgi:hypothetical protein
MLFCSSNITFRNNTICFASFVKSNFKIIKDIWDTTENFKNCNENYNSLNDQWNCISEHARVKKAVPKEFVPILQGEITIDPSSNRDHLLKLNNNLYLYDKKETTMIHFLLALKSSPKILKKKNKLIYQIKWVVLYGEDIVNIYYLSIVKKNKKEKQKMIRTRYRAYKNHLYLWFVLVHSEI